MITSKDLQDLLGLEADQVKMIIFHYKIKKIATLGRAVILDPDDVRKYVEEILPEQIEDLNERIRQKESGLANLKAYLDDPDQQDDKPEHWLSIREAAALMKCSRTLITRLIEEGKLETRWLNNATRIVRRDSLEANREAMEAARR